MCTPFVWEVVDFSLDSLYTLFLFKSAHRKVAIKSLEYSEKTRAAVDKEVELVLGLSHRNIIRHSDTFIVTSDSIVGTEKYLFLVMDYCHTSLETIIQEHHANGSRPTKLAILNWILQICNAVHYLHITKNIIHRDLKPENVLILTTIDDRGDVIRGETDFMVKLCDFGSATKYGTTAKEMDSRPPMSVVGTPLFMAPEVIMGKDYDYSADVYSMGILILQMLLVTPAVQMPNVFQNLMRDQSYMGKLCDGNKLDPPLSKLVQQCCRLNPNERPSINVILQTLTAAREEELSQCE